MTIEDFFTLNEMKDGLATLSRVEELIYVMKEEKNNGVNNIGDSSRQWSIVAEVLTATENKDCLNHFIKLDGLHFLNQWLQEAVKCANGSNKMFFEELVEALLAMLEKLHTDNKAINLSGVRLTVEQLISHGMIKGHERAITLFQSWNQDGDTESCLDEKEKNGANWDDNVKSGANLKMVPVDNGVEYGSHVEMSSETPTNSQFCSVEVALPTKDGEGYSEVPPADAQSERTSDGPDRRDGAAPNTIAKADSDSKESVPYGSGGKEQDLKTVWQSSNLSGSSSPGESGTDTDTKESGETGVVDSCIFEEASKPNSEDIDDIIMDRRSGMELDYTEDALEVARLVARQVEREVVDYREVSVSSDKNSQDVTTGSGNLDEGGKTRSSQSRSGGSCGERCVRVSARDEGDHGIDIGEPVGTEALEESVGNVEKNICDFDLNEDAYGEDTGFPAIFDCNMPKNVLSFPIPVVAVSKGVSSIPVAPFHFGGEMGWRGSAATSAFRRASPRKTGDAEKCCFGEGSSHSVKRKHNVLDIDLNVAEGDEDLVVSMRPAKRGPVSSGLMSGESSVEVSSQKVEKLNLDLNQLGDHEEADQLQDQRLAGRFSHPGLQVRRSPSPASSSSSKQPLYRDFDLNDKPSLVDGCGFQDSRQDLGKIATREGKSSSSGFKLDDPVVLIMGSRIKPEGNNFVNVPNGRIANNAIGSSMMHTGNGSMGGRLMQTYHQGAPVLGYNGYTMSSPMPLPQLYGPSASSYTIDTGVPTVVPQMMGTAHHFPRPPFLMSVNGSASGFTRFGLDLNSGLVPMEGESQGMGLRHLSFQGYGGVMEEQMKSGLHHGGGGINLKRKEPECGWELNMVGCGQEMPWHR